MLHILMWPVMWLGQSYTDTTSPKTLTIYWTDIPQIEHFFIITKVSPDFVNFV